ncbi:urease subunit beta [Streptomyces sp. G1]|uniref:urease subunit beta n=1 Tax=Streptomyces sp. G1 TaxID=361572 RepID=UPI00202DE97E|nr:urease subunit beta [Streptomyces sp. G1]MCM1965288.1 urease subunit beta [Streptomyces sp. G1]
MSGGATYLYGEGTVEINAGRRKAKVTVSNTGDRAVQVGSHYHFFEVNRALDFDRNAAYGMHLDLPAGTGVRFEPGDTREVELTAYSGHGRLIGFSSLVNGGLGSTDTRVRAMNRAVELGFLGARTETAQQAAAAQAAAPAVEAPSKPGSRPGSKPASKPAARPAAQQAGKPAAKAPAKTATAKKAKTSKKGDK